MNKSKGISEIKANKNNRNKYFLIFLVCINPLVIKKAKITNAERPKNLQTEISNKIPKWSIIIKAKAESFNKKRFKKITPFNKKCMKSVDKCMHL